MIDFKDILEKDSQIGLHTLHERILTNPAGDGVTLHLESYYGFLYEGVETISKKYKADLIVMGTTGASTLSRRIFGSNTSHLIKRIHRPILAVPSAAVWRSWNHTILATDFTSDRPAAVYTHLKSLTNGMKVSLDVLHIIENTERKPDFGKMESRFIAEVGNTNVEFHYEPAETVVDGILNYTLRHDCDVLVMLKHRHGFVEQLFNTSATRKLALHMKNPILILPE